MAVERLPPRKFILRNADIRDRAAAFVASLPVDEARPFEVLAQEHEEVRSGEQNSRMWAMLADIAGQVKWPVNGSMQQLTKEDFKDILTAGLEQGQRLAQGIEGGFVVLGARTSKMSKHQMSLLIELAQFFGDQRGVKWTDPKRYNGIEQET